MAAWCKRKASSLSALQAGKFRAEGATDTVKQLKKALPGAYANMEQDLQAAVQAVAVLRKQKERLEPPSRFAQFKALLPSIPGIPP